MKDSKTKLLLGIAIIFILKIIYKLVRATIKAIANIIVFFGLYIPLFYAVYGFCLIMWAGLNLDVMCVDTYLFYAGFGLACVCSIIITVRNRIVEPLSSVFASYKEEVFPSYEEERRKWLTRHGNDKEIRRYQEEQEKQEKQAGSYDYNGKNSNGENVSYNNQNTESGNEGNVSELLRAPFYSESDPDVLVYDYKSYTDFYRMSDDGKFHYERRMIK